MKKHLCFLFIVILHAMVIQAQPAKQLITILVSPDHQNWDYRVGEEAVFSISVFKNDYPLQNIKVEYRVGPEGMPSVNKGTIILKEGTGTYSAGTMKHPGFLRLYAKVEYDGEIYEKCATAGFDVDMIEPTTKLPDDFEAFWKKWKDELAKIPVNPVLTLMPSQCTDKVDVYQVCMQNIEGKIYGVLCKPKKEGKFPAILYLPGAGVRATSANLSGAENGFITLEIGIHGIPVDLKESVYSDLKEGALKYYYCALMDDRDNYYYKRVYLGCVRAVDFIFSLPFFDGNHLAVTGGSQGGALSIVTAALDNRITCLAALHPALSDMTALSEGRAAGWPNLFRTKSLQIPERIETSRYYDVVNFARFIKATGWYSWGYNDNICPPTSVFAAYNVITAPKEKFIFLDTQHWTYPEQIKKRMNWIYEQLSK